MTIDFSGLASVHYTLHFVTGRLMCPSGSASPFTRFSQTYQGLIHFNMTVLVGSGVFYK